MIKLGVNIDHIATIRQARRTFEPDPVTAASFATLGGADIITLHLREDRRHIQDRDVRLMRETVFSKLNLEMSVTEEIVALAVKLKPEQAALVPEKREEITTEGGLDVVSQKKLLTETVKKLKAVNIQVCLFIDPEKEQISAAKEVGSHCIELHTGNYANAKDEVSRYRMIEKLQRGVKFARAIGLRVNAGHGLTYQNVGRIIECLDIEELHIGHSIIARSVFVGIQKAVSEMKELIFRYEQIKLSAVSNG